MMVSYFTLCVDLRERSCLVVGGGEVARRRAAALSDSDAKVRVVSPKLDPILEYMALQKEIEWIEREFEPHDINETFLVIAATNNRATNQTISELCKEKSILCNTVDQHEEGNFIVPTTIQRGALTIAIQTSGINPVLSSAIRQELELAYGEEYGTFLSIVAQLRPLIKKDISNPTTRQRVYEKMVSSRALSLLRSGLKDEAEKELQEITHNAIHQFKKEGNTSGPSLPIVNLHTP